MDSKLQIDVQKVLLFTGHMIDSEDRKEPRFPKEREAEVRLKIKKSIEIILKSKTFTDHFVAIAGGACGGDIIFLELCLELGIPIKMLLALPAEKFIAESVAFAGSSWVDRFYRIYRHVNTEVSIMAETKDLTVSSKENNTNSFWEKNNLWLLNTAFAYGGNQLTLIAVWDGKGADGPGGTRHMIEEVKDRGAESLVIRL